MAAPSSHIIVVVLYLGVYWLLFNNDLEFYITTQISVYSDYICGNLSTSIFIFFELYQ